MSNIDKIRQEIERRLKYTHDWLRGDEKRHPRQTAISKNYYKMKGDERTLDALLAFIDSLPEEDLYAEVGDTEEDYIKRSMAKVNECRKMTCKESLQVQETCKENGNELPRFYGD